jgi:hypothetical protein
LAACSINPQNNCSQQPVQQYPSVQLISPASGSTNVPLMIGTVVVASATSSIVGSVTVSGPGTTWTLNLMPDGNAGGLSQFSAAIPPLAPLSTYTVQHVVTYPAACLAPLITKSQTAGSFKSGT